MLCTWHVRYSDGSELFEYQTDHPLAVEGQVGWRHIVWEHGVVLSFVSEQAQVQLRVPPPASGCRYRLTRRTVTHVESGREFPYIALISEVADGAWPPDPANVLAVLYWFPTGLLHECARLGCDLVAAYQQNMLWSRPAVLPSTH